MVAMTHRTVSLASVVGIAGISWGLLFQATSTKTTLARLTEAQSPPAIVTSWAMWMLMMIAMMLPAVLPWVDAFAAATQTARRQLAFFRVSFFCIGYFAAWAGFSLAAAILQLLLAKHGAEQIVIFTNVGPLALAGAGLYQLSPIKRACLDHCRSPMAFFLTRWRGGVGGGWQMGLEHGLFCIGCCWALMSLCVVLGVMNLLWMAGLTVFVCVEQIATRGAGISRAGGIALLGWAAVVALR